jgi:hypothetical protein
MNARPVPFVPNHRAVREGFATAFTRAVVASLMGARNRNIEPTEKIAQRLWPHATDVPLMLKSASVPADLVTPTWAAGLASPGSVVDVISILAPASAGAAVLARGLHFPWERGTSALSIPTINVSTPYVHWVAEGMPRPVLEFLTGKVTLGPKKLAAISVFSHEMLDHSTPIVEKLVRTVLAEHIGLAIDTRLFSANASDSVSPGGLLVGVTPITASTDSIGSEAMTRDIAELVAAVSTVAGNSPIVLVMSPRQAATMKARVDVGAFDVYASAALPDRTLVGLATNALFSVGDNVPTYETGNEMTLHMDTSPQPIAGASGPIAAPTYSAFQMDLLGIRVSLSLNWTLRNPAGVAMIQNTSW